MSYTTLVDAATLAANLATPDWRVIDVRHQLTDVDYGERAYAAGHVPGANFLHCDRDLSGAKNGKNGRHPLPEREALAARLAACGIGDETQVVVYDDCQGMIAGRLWWMLRWLGHDAVAVLDGGWQAWLAAGGAASTAVPTPPARKLSLGTGVQAVTVDDVLKHLDSAALRLVDARSPERFRGENETMDPVGGHIPGAVNRFFRDNLQENGCFKPAAQLRAEWLQILAGAPPDRVVHSCGSGVSGCHNLLAMAHAGLAGARLYAGSWSEWCADPQRPVER